MRALIPLALILLLAACAGGAGSRPSPASYDLSSAVLEPDSGQAGILRQVDVQSPAWIDTPAMQYRLSYADKARREVFAASRWVASPARLLEQQLKQRLLSGAGGLRNQAASCRLRVELDEFVQDFDSPASSQVILAARAVLLAPRHETFLARQHFRVVHAAGADARSGAAALDAAARQFGEEIEDWLRRAGKEVLDRCRLS